MIVLRVSFENLIVHSVSSIFLCVFQLESTNNATFNEIKPNYIIIWMISVDPWYAFAIFLIQMLHAKNLLPEIICSISKNTNPFESYWEQVTLIWWCGYHPRFEVLSFTEKLSRKPPETTKDYWSSDSLFIRRLSYTFENQRCAASAAKLTIRKKTLLHHFLVDSDELWLNFLAELCTWNLVR